MKTSELKEIIKNECIKNINRKEYTILYKSCEGYGIRVKGIPFDVEKYSNIIISKFYMNDTIKIEISEKIYNDIVKMSDSNDAQEKVDLKKENKIYIKELIKYLKYKLKTNDY